MGKTANIMFTGGVVHTPSDLSPRDGDLNECINLVPSDGELKPIEMPEKVMSDASNQLQLDGTLAAVHEGKWGKNLISIKDKDTMVFSTQSGTAVKTQKMDSDVTWVRCIGLIVMVGLKEKPNVYFAYKDDEYKYLGIHPQYVPIRFSFAGGKKFKESSSTPVSKVDGEEQTYTPIVVYRDYAPPKFSIYGKDNDELNYNRKNFAESIYTDIVTIQNKAKKEGLFISPFFLRYAMKLYDGSYINLSQPLLMMPSTYKTPFTCGLGKINGYYECDLGLYNKANVVVQAFASRLTYLAKCVLSPEWDDFIQSIDIFVTSPIMQFDSEEIIEQFPSAGVVPSEVDIGYIYGEGKDELIEKVDPETDYNWIYYNKDFYYGNRRFVIPSYGKDKIDGFVKDNAMLFYHIASIDYDRFIIEENALNQYVYGKLDIDAKALENLETRKTLPDSKMGSLSQIIAETAIDYNSRMIVGNIKTYDFFYPDAKYPIPDESNFNITEAKIIINNITSNAVIKIDERDIHKYLASSYIYFPDANAKKVMWKYNDKYYARKLWQSYYLNGAFAFTGLQSLYESIDDEEEISKDEYDKYTTTNIFYYQNRIMVSNVSNPLVFDTLNMIEVGTRQILGLSTYALPMSQGQFGQYPVVVFSDDGIRSLGINGDGTIGSVAPVSTADVLTGFAKPGRPNVISDGQSLYFITRRGIMRMSGLSVQCISDVLDGRRLVASDYAGITNTNEGPNEIRTAVRNLIAGVADYRTFDAMLAGGDAWLAFDYRNGRIIVTDPEQPAPYVYSIRYNQWSRMLLNRGTWNDNFFPITDVTQRAVPVKFQSSVFNYTESYMQDGGGGLWDLMGSPDENVDGGYKFGFLMSRPIRFGTDDYKTLERVIHRRRIDSPFGKIGMRLYGSADGIVWHEIRSFRGAAFKYYSVGVYTCMKANERYAYMSAEFTEKHTDKLR